MTNRRLILAVLAPVVLLSGCASSAYGGSISGSSQALSPEERRLQTVETKAAELARRLDSVNLAGLDQENQRLRDDIRQLRGEVERLRYDVDQQQRKLRDQVAEMDKRLQRFEQPLGIAPPTGAVAPVVPSGPAPGSIGTVPPPPMASGVATVPPVPVAPPPPVMAPTSPGAPVVISSGSGASVEEETAYLAAFDQLKNGKYDAAIKGFKGVLDKWPQGTYAPNAWYWMGEAQTVKRDYKSAEQSFQALLSRFPTSPKAPDAMLKVGLSQIELKREAEGRATLQRVIASYPNSNAAKLAQQRLNPPR